MNIVQRYLRYKLAGRFDVDEDESEAEKVKDALRNIKHGIDNSVESFQDEYSILVRIVNGLRSSISDIVYMVKRKYITLPEADPQCWELLNRDIKGEFKLPKSEYDFANTKQAIADCTTLDGITDVRKCFQSDYKKGFYAIYSLARTVDDFITSLYARKPKIDKYLQKYEARGLTGFDALWSWCRNYTDMLDELSDRLKETQQAMKQMS